MSGTTGNQQLHSRFLNQEASLSDLVKRDLRYRVRSNRCHTELVNIDGIRSIESDLLNSIRYDDRRATRETRQRSSPCLWTGKFDLRIKLAILYDPTGSQKGERRKNILMFSQFV